MARRRKKKKKNSLLLVIILGILSFLLYKNPDLIESFSMVNNDVIIHKIEADGSLYVYYIDVGEADSILISNNGHNMLIDAGNNEDGPKLVNYLKNGLGITSFDYVVGTHPHEDHIGGLDDIINSFQIGEVYLPDSYTTTKTFEDVLTAIENKNLEINVPDIGEEFILSSAIFRVLYTGTDIQDLNNASIVLRMDFGDKAFLFTGDATESIEKELIKIPKLIDVDVLKVAHHGSEYSSIDSFLNYCSPEYAIISVGIPNSYGHPGENTLYRLKKYGANILRTDELGTIILTSDGKDISLYNEKTDTNG